MSRTTNAPAPTISLFPFLAVLLCTMGALLVLLVIFSNSARQRPGPSAADVEAERELETARDTLAWRAGQLDEMRERTLADLAAARMQLAGIEENGRNLQDELAGLERQAAALAAGARPDEDAARLDAELQARLQSARESRDKALAEKQSRPPAYAVVPYAGASGTHRRPLYIECCGDGVFLQPEGIRLNPADFEGPPGPGNPLASALRAAREHIVGVHGGAGDPGRQPYPLLLVRPSGVIAYYAARESIQSWGSDFGYQLVDEDWTLAFPPADPTLAQVERRAIEEARQRLAWLAEVRPVRQPRQPQQYRAAPTRGGVVVDGGPSVLGDQSRWDFAQGGRGDGGGGLSAGQGGGTGPGGGNAGGRGRPGAAATAAGGGPGGAGDGGGGGFGAGGPGRGGPGGSGKAGGQAGLLAGNPQSGDTTTGAGGADKAAFGVGGTPGGTSPGDGSRPAGAGADGGADGGDGVASGPAGAGPAGAAGPRSQGGSTPGPSGSIAGGAAGAAGGPGATGSAAGGSSGGSAGGSGAGSGGNLSGGPAMPGLVGGGGGAPQAAGGSSASASLSLAQSRGRDWASLATRDRPVGLTRPVRIECAGNEFRILDDSGRRVENRVSIDGETAASVDPLVRAVHRKVEQWGIAGERMYWRPQLVLSETPDGRGRRQDLERLLADSGIDTRSVEVGDRIVPLPPVERSAAAAPRR
jgi:hypothetical protein